jgi:anti-sigma factor RsiW
MKCSEVEYMAPLYWSGELDAQATAELDRHLQSCSVCAHAMELERHGDELIQQAAASEQVNAAPVLARVRAQIAAESPSTGLRWRSPWRWAALVAATAAAALFVFILMPRNINSSTPPVQVQKVAPAVNILADAADDHHDEVVEHLQREWLYSTSEIRKLVQEGTGSSTVLTELTPDGYHVERARICELGHKNYLHLVYSDGTHEVSMFVRQQDGEQLAGAERDKVNGTPLLGDSYEKLQVAAFQSPRYTVVVVSDQPMNSTVDFARKAAGAVKTGDKTSKHGIPSRLVAQARESAVRKTA